MKRFALLTLSLFCFSSCQVLISSILGVKEPVAKSDNQVRDSINKIYRSFPIYRIREDKIDSLFKEEYKPGWGSGFKPIQFICFDRKGEIVAQWASCESSLNSYSLKTYPPRSRYLSNTKLTIERIIKSSNILIPGKNTLEDYTRYDYTYVVYTCSWTEKLSINMLYKIINYTKKQPSYNIVIINTDYYRFNPG